MQTKYPFVTVDQMGESCKLQSKPKRIISLVPSQTELLFDLGLDDEIVGITKFCNHPVDKVKACIKIGGTKKFNYDVIAELKPDLIIGNKEENYQEGIEYLKQLYPVWMSDIANIEDALQMISAIGKLVEKPEKAQQMVLDISESLSNQGEKLSLSAAYLIWQQPFMTVGKGTFIDEIMQLCGLQNIFAEQERYPETTLEELKKLQPDVLMLSTEPYPFKNEHVEILQSEFPDTKVILVDAMYFSWYGSRLLGTGEYSRSVKQLLLK